MTRYVVPVPDPDPGADWETVVPGRYLYDVTGITAKLTTGGPAGVTAVDASGNGNDGIYNVDIPPVTFVAGLVAGDLALELGLGGAAAPNVTVDIPPAVIQWANPFTILFLWSNPTAGAGFGGRAYIAPPNSPTSFAIQLDISDGVLGVIRLGYQLGPDWISVPGVIPRDGNPHLIAVTITGSTVVMYVDGVAVTLASTDVNPAGGSPVQAGLFGVSGSGACSGIGDEYALFARALSAGEVVSVQAARGSFVAFSTAVLGLGPDAYYHLDDDGASTGRQPTLIVTDGTHELLAIPTGFPAVTTPGPYGYAWQPGLNADTQSVDGKLTTVAIPRLVIPAGYTVGVRTLDLQVTDQWSEISLWWDDAVQEALPEFNPYVYAPGVNLQYRQIGT